MSLNVHFYGDMCSSIPGISVAQTQLLIDLDEPSIEEVRTSERRLRRSFSRVIESSESGNCHLKLRISSCSLSRYQINQIRLQCSKQETMIGLVLKQNICRVIRKVSTKPNTTKQSSSLEAHGYTAGQKLRISSVYSNMRYRHHKCPSPDPILNHKTTPHPHTPVLIASSGPCLGVPSCSFVQDFRLTHIPCLHWYYMTQTPCLHWYYMTQKI